jgi:hypothetical protein
MIQQKTPLHAPIWRQCRVRGANHVPSRLEKPGVNQTKKG